MQIAPTAIDLLDGCSNDGHCAEFANKLRDQLSNGYTHDASLMPAPPHVALWAEQHRTAARRAARAKRLGYVFAPIDRRRHEDDVFEVNTSKHVRQGRPMSDGYNVRPTFGANPMVCPRHHVYTYGVLEVHDVGVRLRAYLWLYRSGELAMVSSILGHAAHLNNDVMYLLFRGVIDSQARHGGTFFYNLHRSGTDGLRFFKARLGFERGDVEYHT